MADDTTTGSGIGTTPDRSNPGMAAVAGQKSLLWLPILILVVLAVAVAVYLGTR